MLKFDGVAITDEKARSVSGISENHPFKITADISMVELKESIEKFGILNPMIIRPVLDGCYEIISCHIDRRFHSALGYFMRSAPEIHA
jgi:hypothetical protein